MMVLQQLVKSRDGAFWGLCDILDRGRCQESGQEVPAFSRPDVISLLSSLGYGKVGLTPSVLGSSFFGSSHFSPPGNCQPPFLLCSSRSYIQDTIGGWPQDGGSGPELQAGRNPQGRSPGSLQGPGGEAQDGVEAPGKRTQPRDTPLKREAYMEGQQVARRLPKAGTPGAGALV